MVAAENLTLHRYPYSNTGYVEVLAEGVELTLMQIPAGEFLMGSAADDSEGKDSERPQHLVKVPRFFMGRTPVTQAQWRAVAGYEQVRIELDPDPSNFKGDDLPVESVDWYEAKEFCDRLSRFAENRLSQKGNQQKPISNSPQYRLPSEAEWEYACRATMTTAYHFGDRIENELANYEGDQTSAVASSPPNLWGLYDLHGNVWEWCEDDYHSSYQGAPGDGRAWVEADRSRTTRILRGGSWDLSPRYCRSAYRDIDFPDFRDYSLGFRVVCASPRT